MTHDTAQFAVTAVRLWWEKMGRYPGADRVMITADGGGSNGARCGSANFRRWLTRPA